MEVIFTFSDVKRPSEMSGGSYIYIQWRKTTRTGTDGAVAMSSANGLVGTGFDTAVRTQSGFLKAQSPEATTPSCLSLTSNRVTTYT